MAVIKAQASGNWNSSATWSGGIIPSLNDTVYANGFNITINQNIDLTGSTIDTSGSFIPGQLYQIVSVGTTNWALVANCIIPGTNAGTPTAISSAVGQIFQAVNAGTATTGTARRIGGLLNHINTPLSIATGGGFTISSNYNVTGAYILAGSANCLTISGTANSTFTNSWAVGSPVTQSVRGILISSTGTITCSNVIVVGGRVVGTTNTNASHGIEINSAGTIAFSNASTITGGIGSYSMGIYNSTGASQLTFTGGCTVTGGSANTNAWAISASLTSSITYTGGNIYGGNSGGIISNGTVIISGCTILGQTGPALFNNGTSNTFTISGSTITGGSADYGIINNSTGSLIITTSTVTGGSSGTTSYGVFNNSTGTVSIQGDIIASTVTNGFYGIAAGANVTLCGSQISSSNGFAAVVCNKYLVNPTPTSAKIRHAKSGTGTYSNFFTADNTLSQANPTDVRNGVSYASGALTGTLTVPSEGTVSNGVTVGPLMPFTATRSSTTATATLSYSYPYVAGDTIVVTGASNTEWNGTYTIASVISGTSITFTVPITYSSTAGSGANLQTVGTAMLTSAAIFNTLTSTMTTAGSIGERLANVSTVAVTGQQITNALG